MDKVELREVCAQPGSLLRFGLRLDRLGHGRRRLTRANMFGSRLAGHISLPRPAWYESRLGHRDTKRDFDVSPVRSPLRRLYLRFTYATIASVHGVTSNAHRAVVDHASQGDDGHFRRAANDIREIVLPKGSLMGTPAPISAAMGSLLRYIWHAHPPTPLARVRRAFLLE